MVSLLNPHGTEQTLVETFNQPLIPLTIASASIFFLVTFFSLRPHLTPKQQGWLLSMLSSACMTLGSLPFVFRLAWLGWDLTLLDGDSYMSAALVSIFLTYLTMDLVLGSLYYPKYVDPLTGWMHHSAYALVLAWILQNQFSQIFCIMCLLEAPTFCLALGQMWKHLRRDYIFASCFFSTRLVFHVFMISITFLQLQNPWAWKVMALPLPMHIFWFNGFIQQQRRLAKLRKVSTTPPTNLATDPLAATAAATATAATADMRAESVSTATSSHADASASSGIRPSHALAQRRSQRTTTTTVIVPPEFTVPSPTQRAKNASKMVLDVAVETKMVLDDAVERVRKSERVGRLMERLGVGEFRDVAPVAQAQQVQVTAF